MSAFVFIVVAMTLLALFMIIRPLDRHTRSSELSRKDINVDLYQQRLDELQLELENGQIEQDAFDAASRELKQQLLEDTRTEEPGQLATGSPSGLKPLLYIAIPVATVALYLGMGEYRAIDRSNIRMPDKAGHDQAPARNMPSIDVMAQRLAEKLKKNPNNLRGWLLLGETYRRMGVYDKAAAAYARAITLEPGNANILTTYADMLTAANNGQFTKPAMDAILKALAIDNRHPKALWLAGTAMYRHGQYKTAIKYWQRLASLLPEGSKDREVILGNIAQASKLAGIKVQVSQKPGAAPVPHRIHGTIVLKKELASKLPENATLFIVARAVNGTRVPLAVIRQPVGKFPRKFTLDDSNSMSPRAKLSQHDKVYIVVRVSKSGQARPEKGDLAGRSKPIQLPVKTAITVTIDQLVR